MVGLDFKEKTQAGDINCCILHVDRLWSFEFKESMAPGELEGP